MPAYNLVYFDHILGRLPFSLSLKMGGGGVEIGLIIFSSNFVASNDKKKRIWKIVICELSVKGDKFGVTLYFEWKLKINDLICKIASQFLYGSYSQ